MPCLNCSSRHQHDLTAREVAIRRAGKEDPPCAPLLWFEEAEQTDNQLVRTPTVARKLPPPGFGPPRICQACGVVYFPPDHT